MAELIMSPPPLHTASPISSATVHSDSSPRPSLIPLVSFSTASLTTSSTRSFFPSSHPPSSFRPQQHRKKAPLTPIPARLLPSNSRDRENDSSQANRPSPPARLVGSPSLKQPLQRDEAAEAVRLLCQRPVGDGRGERRAAGGSGRSDKQYSDDMFILTQLPALLEAGQPAGSMDRVFRLLADSIDCPRSKQASTALALLPSLLTSHVQAASASVSVLFHSLLHCYLHGEKFLQRDVPPLLQQCMALSGVRWISFWGAKERGGSKNARDRAISACMLHAALSLFTTTNFTAYDGCTTCPTSLPSSTSTFSIASLPSTELSATLFTLHVFVSDGQASTRYHARHAIRLLCTHAAPLALDVALKALPFEHTAAIRAIAPTPSPTSSLTSSPPSSTRPRHHTMPSPTPPPPPPSASPPRQYATLPDEREWDEWKQQPGLVSPIKGDSLLAEAKVESDVTAAGTSPQQDDRGEEDDEVVVRVHSARAAVSPVPFVGDDEEEEDEEVSVLVSASQKQQAVHEAWEDAAAVKADEPSVTTVAQSAIEQMETGTTARQLNLSEEDAAGSAAAEPGQDTPLPSIHSPPSFTPARSSTTDLTRLSTKRKRSESPAPVNGEADKGRQPLCITSTTHWLQLCKEEGASSHQRVLQVSAAAVEWLARGRQEGAERRATEQCVVAAERQMRRMAAVMERVRASAEALHRTRRMEAAVEESA